MDDHRFFPFFLSFSIRRRCAAIIFVTMLVIVVGGVWCFRHDDGNGGDGNAAAIAADRLSDSFPRTLRNKISMNKKFHIGKLYNFFWGHFFFYYMCIQCIKFIFVFTIFKMSNCLLFFSLVYIVDTWAAHQIINVIRSEPHMHTNDRLQTLIHTHTRRGFVKLEFMFRMKYCHWFTTSMKFSEQLVFVIYNFPSQRIHDWFSPMKCIDAVTKLFVFVRRTSSIKVHFIEVYALYIGWTERKLSLFSRIFVRMQSRNEMSSVCACVIY